MLNSKVRLLLDDSGMVTIIQINLSGEKVGITTKGVEMSGTLWTLDEKT